MQKQIKNVKITAISTCVAKDQFDVFDNKVIYGGNTRKLRRISTSTGFRYRHLLDNNQAVTASDMAIKSAEALFNAGIKKDDIDAVIMVTQYPDYFEPATACVIHGKLGLKEQCIAFDINQGCSGYIYGLLTASSLIDKNIRKVLLLAGDTSSKMIGRQLDITDDMPIFSDGSCATILEYDETSQSMFFDIGAKGSDYEVLISENGGFRNRPAQDMFDKNGNFDYKNHMDGLKVFEFTMNIVPPSINKVMQMQGINDNDIDYYLIHQANKMILENIAVSAKIDIKKVLLSTLTKYGNLSSASIASIICDEYEKFHNKTNKVVLTGFGVGLSWGSISMTLSNPYVLPIIYY